MDADAANVPTCDVFAVFKDKTVPRSALDSLEVTIARGRVHGPSTDQFDNRGHADSVTTRS